MEWTDGSSYAGEWYCGIQHGIGKMTFPNGIIREGVFENNIFKGSVGVVGYTPMKPKKEDGDACDTPVSLDPQ